MDFRMAACPEIKQADAAGSHQKSGGAAAETKAEFPNSYLLWGVEGQLAGNALKAQKKARRMASFSLILSFMAFTLMQCFFTLSGISTRETYFEKYQDAWDIMVTVKDTEVDSFQKRRKYRLLREQKALWCIKKRRQKEE